MPLDHLDWGRADNQTSVYLCSERPGHVNKPRLRLWNGNYVNSRMRQAGPHINCKVLASVRVKVACARKRLTKFKRPALFSGRRSFRFAFFRLSAGLEAADLVVDDLAVSLECPDLGNVTRQSQCLPAAGNLIVDILPERRSP